MCINSRLNLWSTLLEDMYGQLGFSTFSTRGRSLLELVFSMLIYLYQLSIILSLPPVNIR